ncbi:MAG: response regulator [Pseudomonadota bacterium]
MDVKNSDAGADATWSTLEVARHLGLAVRSVQLMVDRGELEAWKTPGGHRRIAQASVARWQQERQHGGVPDKPAAAPQPPPGRVVPVPAAKGGACRVLLIEDSTHFQNLVSLVVRHALPDVDLHIASDGIAGLAMYGQLQPDVLLVDILLPGIDGATLIAGLRTQPQFSSSQLIVITSLDEAQRQPYAFALQGVPVVHKSDLAKELPRLLAGIAADRAGAAGG